MTTNQINYQNAMERIRNDQAIEAETNRHNIAIEAYNRGLLSNQEFSNREVQRHNKIMEQLQNRANEISAAKVAIENRYNQLTYELGARRQAEEERHNFQTELLTQAKNRVDEIVRNAEVRIAERRATWTHQENLLSIAQLGEHYQYSDRTQRGNTLISAFEAITGVGSLLFGGKARA